MSRSSARSAGSISATAAASSWGFSRISSSMSGAMTFASDMRRYCGTAHGKFGKGRDHPRCRVWGGWPSKTSPGNPLGSSSGNQPQQILGGGARVEEPVAHERDEVRELGRLQTHRAQQRAQALDDRVDRAQPRRQIRSDALGRRDVPAVRGLGIVVVPDRVLERREGAVVEEGRLQGDVAQRGGAELVPVGRVARDLLAGRSPRPRPGRRTELSVLGAELRRDLRNADDVDREVAEHLVRRARDRVALHAAGLAEEQQRPALLRVGQRVAVAPREPVDRRVGEVSANSNSAIAWPNMSKVIGRPRRTRRIERPNGGGSPGVALSAAEHGLADRLVAVADSSILRRARACRARSSLGAPVREAGHLGPLGRRDEGLRHEQVGESGSTA